MRNTLIMLYYRYRLIFSNWKILIISLILPIFLSYGIGFLFKDYSGINSIPIGIIDNDKSVETKTFISQLNNSKTLNPILYNDKKTAINSLENNRIEAIFTINKGFAEAISSGNTKKIEKIVNISFLENNLMAGALGDIFARNIIKISSPYICAKQVKTMTDDISLYNKTYMRSIEHMNNPKFALVVESQINNSNDNSSKISTKKLIANRFAIGMTLAISSFYMMYIGASTIEERKKATFYRIYATGNNPNIIIFASYTSFASIVVLLQLLLLNISLKIFSYSLIPSVMLFIIGFCSTIVGISLLTASLFENSVSYQSLSMTLVFFICLFGGAFWSLELIPSNVAWIKILSPVYWILEFLLQLSKHINASIIPALYLFIVGVIATNISSILIKNRA